jgi:threonine dehydratase
MTGERDFRAGVVAARARIGNEAVWTPLERSKGLSARLGAHVHVKWESEQRTGSFKFRGALSAIRSLPQESRARGIVSASTGNHGLAVGTAARLEGTDLVLFVPETIVPSKLDKLRRAGIAVTVRGPSCERTEILARASARDEGRTFLSPYNDVDVIMGQGTVAYEIFRDFPEVDVVFVPVGGGGLAAGIAAYLRNARPDVRVFGVEPETSAFMAASLAAGRLVDVEEGETAADAVAGGIEPGSITFGLCRMFLEDVVTVTEGAIASAMSELFRLHGRMVEAAGALALAGAEAKSGLFRDKNVVLVASGGNI